MAKAKAVQSSDIDCQKIAENMTDLNQQDFEEQLHAAQIEAENKHRRDTESVLDIVSNAQQNHRPVYNDVDDAIYITARGQAARQLVIANQQRPVVRKVQDTSDLEKLCSAIKWFWCGAGVTLVSLLAGLLIGGWM